ncbi:hypothetical protein GCM10007913_34490 [Devosia yakushimensis]|uniref:Lipid A 3-O-deacylase (PagL) n=1 Tax=Devosia yakushimensis TaxID=470028 RepID=A0ABQ5UJD1_9HYPH|nr:acyloxyacyl hydrolase [Devosia yakushimensis]GLQ11517.1 hypothetical protein GCM10007913_34490 [Devosia yakushimensis]
MRVMIGRAILALGLMLAAAGSAQAQFDLVPEIRAGVFSRGVGDADHSGLFDTGRIEDANVELLFAVPALSPALVPAEIRPHLGATFNTDGKESMVYGGLSLTFRLPVLPIFAEASLGGALQNGSMFDSGTPRRFGCAALLRASGSVGVDVLPGASVMLTAEHYTDGGMCGDSEALTNVGVRAGIRF